MYLKWKDVHDNKMFVHVDVKYYLTCVIGTVGKICFFSLMQIK